MILVDTTVWVDFLRGNLNPESDWLKRELTERRLGLTDTILCEVLQGIQDEALFETVQKELLRLEIFDTGGLDLAVVAAKNYRRLRESGYTVPKTVDCIIATFCLRDGHTLLHRDRDFDPFEKLLGLSVLHV